MTLIVAWDLYVKTVIGLWFKECLVKETSGFV